MRSRISDAAQTVFTVGWISVVMLLVKFYADLH